MNVKLLLFSIFSCVALGQQVVDLTNPIAVTNATNAATLALISYYSPNKDGYIASNEASDASGIQWYENGNNCLIIKGIMWETILRIAQVTGDPSHIRMSSDALSNASFYSASSFLG
jgi:hypothetical protein